MPQKIMRLPVEVPRVNVARLLRIGMYRQGTTKRVLPSLTREAIIILLKKEEARLKLRPLTKRQQKKLLEAA